MIYQSDRDRLLPRVWLNDTIMEFALRYFWLAMLTVLQTDDGQQNMVS